MKRQSKKATPKLKLIDGGKSVKFNRTVRQSFLVAVSSVVLVLTGLAIAGALLLVVK